MASSATYHHRARVASLTRDRQPNDPELIEARRSLAEESLADHIRRVVDAAPPLTSAQRDKLAALLHHPTSAKAGGDSDVA